MTAGTPTRRTAAARLTPLACNRLHRQSHTDRAAWGTGPTLFCVSRAARGAAGEEPKMIVVMRAGAAPAEIEAVAEHIRGLGFRPHLSQGEERTIIGVIGNDRRVDPDELTWLP